MPKILQKIILSLLTISLISLTFTNLIFAQNSNLCTLDSPINLSNTKNKHLVKLNQYQNICKSKIGSELMIFAPTPTDTNSAIEISLGLFNNAKAFAKYGIVPLVVMEPNDINGDLIGFRQLADGKFNFWVNKMFANLVKLGLTTAELGTVVILPEANTPVWNFEDTTEKDFSTIFNNMATSIKSQYPNSKLSIMLNSNSYAPDDTDWENPLENSFLDYTRGIKKEFINSVGLQGLPFISRKNRGSFKINNPQEYLPTNKIEEVAKFLGVKKIWLNTGSFVEKYRANREKQNITVPELIWQTQKTSEVAGNLKDKGYSVTVNYFLADKMQMSEQTNWSLLDSRYHGIFINLVKYMNSRRVNLSIFDA
jgi:hypothetical protein